MRRLAGIPFALLFLGTLLLPRPAWADSIAITEGSLISGRSGGAFIHLEGGSRLTLDGAGGNGRFEPWSHCDGTPELCGAGARVPLLALWSGSDFTGVVTLDGQRFSIGMGSESQGSAVVEFTGSFVTPSFTGEERMSVVAPFLFRGLLGRPEGLHVPPIPLLGHGTARIDLLWRTTAGGAWEFERARYDFEGAADPVPEPATMMLVGSGIVGCVAAHRRRRRRASC